MAGAGSKASTNRADQAGAAPSTEELLRMIAEATYYRAQPRGFQGGGPVDDWLQAGVTLIGQSPDTPERV